MATTTLERERKKNPLTSLYIIKGTSLLKTPSVQEVREINRENLKSRILFKKCSLDFIFKFSNHNYVSCDTRFFMVES